MSTLDALRDAIVTMQSVIDVSLISAQEEKKPTPCSNFDVGQLTVHIMETHEFLLAAAGGTPPAISGSLSERHAALAAAAETQWERRGTTGTIDLGGNELPAGFGLSLHALETYIHAWDLAKSLDRPFAPTAESTDRMWEFAQSFITDDVRGDSDGAPYGPVVDADPTASLVDRIIALSGRNPRYDASTG